MVRRGEMPARRGADPDTPRFFDDDDDSDGEGGGGAANEPPPPPGGGGLSYSLFAMRAQSGPSSRGASKLCVETREQLGVEQGADPCSAVTSRMLAPVMKLSSGSDDGSFLGNDAVRTDDSGRLISPRGVCAKPGGWEVHIINQDSPDLPAPPLPIRSWLTSVDKTMVRSVGCKARHGSTPSRRTVVLRMRAACGVLYRDVRRYD